MAIRIATANPSTLLAKIRQAIISGQIETWQVDKDGDFTHSPQQWRHRAWLRPFIREESLEFGILPNKESGLGRSVYAIYHGRFIEMLLTHFDGDFDRVSASALLQRPDVSPRPTSASQATR